MNTWHIHIEGQVQGVGFRPLVYRQAQALGLKGWVSNSSDGLHITFNADSTGAQSFYQTLLEQPPPLARIQSHQLEELPVELFEDFQIVGSSRKAAASLLITPDVALCPDCRQELQDTNDRRYQYAFNTCTNCGPRFSIMERLPYDREWTTMAPFEMCPGCAAEYKDPYNRRHYSQTNSCPDCGIQLKLWDAETEWQEGDQVALLDQVVQAWEAGKIVALKGIGGYLLSCDANNETAIQTLRSRKQRPTKPFAVLFPNLEMVESHFQIQPIEAEYLSGPIAPIVLLEQHEKSASILALDAIAPGLKQVGVMLPYAPLYELLLSRFGRPIIATSGNVSKTPIIYQDDKALEQLSLLADLILQHDRAIVLPQDDSVLKIARQSGQPLWYRRSRGLAPTYIQPELDWPPQTWLAVGADLKSTFGLLHRQNTYISPYLGNQEDLESQVQFRHSLEHLIQLLGAQPKVILHDLHPAYAGLRAARDWADQLHGSLQGIQHHQAHFGAVLGEHDLLHSPSPILGVIWDGTGYGTDQQIWGGEFFSYRQFKFERLAHLAYYDHILGDKMAREPRIAALSLAYGNPEIEQLIRPHFSAIEWQLYLKMLSKGSTLQTSSMGRLFDAVASLLDLNQQQSYEGEAAMLVEQCAAEYFQKNEPLKLQSLWPADFDPNRIDVRVLFSALARAVYAGTDPAQISARFLYSLAELVRLVALHFQIHQIAFSGGVFQNSLLVDLLHQVLPEPYQLYFHQQFSPNDENIAFGQLVCHQIEQRRIQLSSKSNPYVLSDSRQDHPH